MLSRQLTNFDKLEAEREYCARGLKYFAERAWHQLEPPSKKYLRGWATDAVCDHLQAVAYGQIKRFACLIPPGCMKSLSTSVFLPAALWGPMGMPEKQIISVSHSKDFAVRDNLKTRDLITSNWYQRLWPLKVKRDRNLATKFHNDKFGFRECYPIGSVTGARGDIVIVDDPLTIEDGNPDRAAITTANRIFRETLQSRVNDPVESAIILIMQVTGEGDVSAVAREMGYETLMLPMEFEPKRKCYTSIGFEDPRTEDLELLFPERYPPETIAQLKIDLGSYAWAAQFQQNPVPRGGGIIKTSWYNYYSIIPPKYIKYRICVGDTAMKTKEYNDYSVFSCWGLTTDNKAYVIDVIRGKWEAPELEKVAIAFWNKQKAILPYNQGILKAFYIEDKASGTGLIQSIKKKGGLPIMGVQVEKDKFTRVTDVLSYIESGHMFLPDPEKVEGATWVSDFIREHEAFSGDGTHKTDDQVDNTSMALNQFYNKRSASWVTKV